MKSKEPDNKLMLSDDVVGDVMQDVVMGSSKNLSIDDNDGTIVMGLSHTTPDVHLSARPPQWTSIFNHHHRWDEGFRIHHKVSHGGWDSGRGWRRGEELRR
jgi:hypothetical protein